MRCIHIYARAPSFNTLTGVLTYLHFTNMWMCCLAEKYTSDTHSVHTGLLLPLLQRRQDVATPSPEEARSGYPFPRGGKMQLPLPQRRQDTATPPPEEARRGCPSPRGGKMWLPFAQEARRDYPSPRGGKTWLLSTGCRCTRGSFGSGMDNKHVLLSTGGAPSTDFGDVCRVFTGPVDCYG